MLSESQPPTKGSWCAAKFTLDNLWYRGYVQDSKGTTLTIYFVDFGNSEVLPPERLRPLDPSLAAIPPQARLWQLAFVKVFCTFKYHGTTVYRTSTVCIPDS